MFVYICTIYRLPRISETKRPDYWFAETELGSEVREMELFLKSPSPSLSLSFEFHFDELLVASDQSYELSRKVG